jgi:hypothetical protein
VASANVTAGSGRAVTAAGQLPAGDGPLGFWWGTDSLPVTVPGSAPYSMPYLGGAYGGYIGMTGNWAYWLNCTGAEHFLAYSATDNTQAHTDYVTYHTGGRVRGVLVHGRARRGPELQREHDRSQRVGRTAGGARAFRHRERGGIDYPVVWIDVEVPGIAPTPDNGWNSFYTSPCSGVVRQSYVSTAVDRADFNGFAAYIAAHSSYKVGVYSSPGSGHLYSVPAP